MKVIVTESQLRNLVKRQRDKRKMEKDVDEAASLTSPSTSNQTTSSSSPSTSTSSSTSNERGSSPGAADYPPYPEVDKAEDLVKRGVANPVDSTKKHEDYPEANPVRGRANPIKGM